MATSKRSSDIKKVYHMVDGHSGLKKTPRLNMLKMEIGNIKMVFIKMRIMNYGAGGGI